MNYQYSMRYSNSWRAEPKTDWKPRDATANTNRNARWRSRWLLSLGLALTLTSTAEAHCYKWHPHHCIDEAADELETVVVENIYDPVTEFVINTGETISEFTAKQINAAGDLAKQGLEEAKKALEEAAIGVYKLAAEAFLGQMKDPLVDMADAWKSVATDHSSDFEALTGAI